MNTDDTGFTREAARQQALVAALWPTDASTTAALEDWCDGRSVTVVRGLQAYRTNGVANATRALEGAYPTVRALVGADGFQMLARELWSAHPPVLGDLAQWGGSLAAFLEAHPDLSHWPYLGDCARLDWAAHRCERAADAQWDSASLARLGDTDPQHLQIHLRPGLAVLTSRWPVVSIHQAHRDGAAHDALDAARDAVQAGVGESVLVCRSGWRAQVHRIDQLTVLWTQRLLAGDSLASALDAVSDASAVGPFDLAGWLTTAIAAGWLKEIIVTGD